MYKGILTILAAVLLAGLVPAASYGMNYGTNGSSCDFVSLAAAINNAGNGGTVFVKATPGGGSHAILQTIRIRDDLTIEGGNANCGRTAFNDPRTWLNATGLANTRAFFVESGTRLTLNKIRLSGGSANNPDGIDTVNGGSILLENGAKLGLFRTLIEGGSALVFGGCVFAQNATISMISDSEIKECSATEDGGGLKMDGGTLYMLEGTSISDNTAVEGSGGNIAAVGPARLVVHGEVSDGDAAERGGGIYLARSGILGGGSPDLVLMNNARMLDNTAGHDGGAIHLRDGRSEPVLAEGPNVRVLDQTRIMRNHAGRKGGAIFALSSTVTASDEAKFEFNTADGSGGAVYSSEASVTGRDSVEFSQNSSDTQGGAIYADGGTVTLRNRVWLYRNTATTKAGALGAANAAEIIVRGDSQQGRIRFAENGADGSGLGQVGGAVSLTGASLLTLHADFTDNYVHGVGGVGGAIDARGGATVKLENTGVRSNTAASGGGIGIYDSTLAVRSIFRSCTPEIQPTGVSYCSSVSNNRATGSPATTNTVDTGGLGGGILLRGESSADIRTTVFKGNTAANQGSVAGHGAAFALTQYAGAGSALLLNAIFDTNRPSQGGLAAAIYANAGQTTVRNSTFVQNHRAVTWESVAQGVFNNNLVVSQPSPVAIWPAGTQGSCNLFTNTDAPLPVGSDNEIATVYLDDNHHPQSPNSRAVDKCDSGPRFDIMGTQRPVNALHDRGAAEFQ